MNLRRYTISWDWARTAPERLRTSFSANPMAWIFFGLFLFVEWSNYEKGRDIRRLCELTAEAREKLAITVRREDAINLHAVTVWQINNICANYEAEPDDN